MKNKSNETDWFRTHRKYSKQSDCVISSRYKTSILRKLPKSQFCLKFLKKSMKDYSTGAELIRMSLKGQKNSEYAISSRSDTPILIKGPKKFFEKILRNFSKCPARMTYSRAKNKKVVKYHFYRENFANWTILDHFQKNFRIKIFLDHPLNF